MTVDETQRRHVLLPRDVAVTAADVRVVSERGRVRARERITHVQLVLERHPDEQVAVTATSSTLCHLLDTSPRDHTHTHTHMNTHTHIRTRLHGTPFLSPSKTAHLCILSSAT